LIGTPFGFPSEIVSREPVPAGTVAGAKDLLTVGGSRPDNKFTPQPAVIWKDALEALPDGPWFRQPSSAWEAELAVPLVTVKSARLSAKLALLALCADASGAVTVSARASVARHPGLRAERHSQEGMTVALAAISARLAERN
jgi:hypothetical protein